MKIENRSLAEIVTSNPEAAVLFENYNLDFCCRGKQKLSEALANDQVTLAEVTDKLARLLEKDTPPLTDFKKLSLTKLVDYILVNHHAYVKENLPVIQQHLQKIATKHGDAHPEMKKIKVLFDELRRDFEQHMMKEEVILFPRIIKLEAAVQANTIEDFSLADPINVMEYEHETAGKIMEEIKKLSANFTPPADACTTFRVAMVELKRFESDLHQHVHLENNILFPKALALQSNLNESSCNCSL